MPLRIAPVRLASPSRAEDKSVCSRFAKESTECSSLESRMSERERSVRRSWAFLKFTAYSEAPEILAFERTAFSKVPYERSTNRMSAAEKLAPVALAETKTACATWARSKIADRSKASRKLLPLRSASER